MIIFSKIVFYVLAALFAVSALVCFFKKPVRKNKIPRFVMGLISISCSIAIGYLGYKL